MSIENKKQLLGSICQTENMQTYDTQESFPMMITTCVTLIKKSLNTRFLESGYNVTTDQWIALIHLWEQDGLTQQTLANRVGRSKVATFNILKRLEKLGLVVRYPDPVDKRSNRVYLSQEGRRIQPQLIPIAKENVKNMTKGISDEEVQMLKSTLKKIMVNLTK